MSWLTYEALAKLALHEYSDIVVDSKIFTVPEDEPAKLRLFLVDNSILDVWISSGKYAFHWDLRPEKNLIYRHDNAPHPKWKSIKTFPKHFHNGDEETVKESFLSDNPKEALRKFMDYIKSKLKAAK